VGRFKSFDEFLDLFPQKPRQRIQNGFNVICPCHNDHIPSLSVSLNGDNTKILLDCKAGCDKDSILKALGISESGLFLDNQYQGEVVATYPYHDANGQLLFEVVRYNPKGFKVRRPDRNGGWVWNLQGVRRVLYRLPDIIIAIGRGDTIYVTEGEKDSDSLRALGLIATTNPFGAGKWLAEYSEMLRAVDAVLVPHNDCEGRKHGISTIDSLEGKAKSLAVLEIPPIAKDVAQWLEQGNTLDDFLSLKNVPPNVYKNLYSNICPGAENSFKSGQIQDNFGTTSTQNWGIYAKKFDEVMCESDGPKDKRDVAEIIGIKPTSDTFRKLLSRRIKVEGKVRPYRRSPYLLEWINRDYRVTQLTDVKAEPFLDIELPLKMHELVKIPPGAVVGVVGYVSSGKTAFLLEIAELNALRQPMIIYYWYNEMSEEKMIIRCEDFPLLIQAQRHKKFFPVKQSAFEFADVLEPNSINLIDYIDRDEDLFLIGGDIRQLQAKLVTGIVVFALQKKHGSTFGYGGLPSAKLANLYVTLDTKYQSAKAMHGEAEIVKCKDWVDSNPVGLYCEYHTGGKHGELLIDGEWRRRSK
jgi:hypothetical protein